MSSAQLPSHAKKLIQMILVFLCSEKTSGEISSGGEICNLNFSLLKLPRLLLEIIINFMS